MVTTPETLLSVPPVKVFKPIFDASRTLAVPELLILPFVKMKFVTKVPLTPLSPVFSINTRSNDGLSVPVSEIPIVLF